MKKEILEQIKNLIDFDNSLQSIEQNNNEIKFIHHDFILIFDSANKNYSFQIFKNRSEVEFYKMIYITELKYILDSYLDRLILGYLPVFWGFYNSFLEIDAEMIICNINADRKILGKNLRDDYNLNLDYEKYYLDVSKSAVDTIETYLINMNLVEYAEFEKLVSPKEYNFNTDSIDVHYLINDNNKKEILKYIEENAQEFDVYIKDKFTTKSGFISFYSNDFKTWIQEIQKWEFKKIETQLSVILEFILLNEDEFYNYTSEIKEDFSMCNSDEEYCLNFNELVEGGIT